MDHIQEPNTPETDKKLPHNLKFYTLIYYPAQYCFLANFYKDHIYTNTTEENYNNTETSTGSCVDYHK